MRRSLVLVKLQAISCNFIKERRRYGRFFCEFYETFQNNFSLTHLRTAVAAV